MPCLNKYPGNGYNGDLPYPICCTVLWGELKIYANAGGATGEKSCRNRFKLQNIRHHNPALKGSQLKGMGAAHPLKWKIHHSSPEKGIRSTGAQNSLMPKSSAISTQPWKGVRSKGWVQPIHLDERCTVQALKGRNKGVAVPKKW